MVEPENVKVHMLGGVREEPKIQTVSSSQMKEEGQ